MFETIAGLRRSKAGNVAIMSAIVAPLLIGVLSLSVDYGAMTLQQRKMQSDADLASIEAAAQNADPVKAITSFFKQNGEDVVVKLVDGVDELGIDDAELLSVFQQTSTDGLVKVVAGNYRPDATVSTDSRFTASRTATNAVKLRFFQRAKLYFAGSFATAPTMAVDAVASNRNLAVFSIGSRLASVNGGLLNKILTALVGTSVDLNVMDYNALARAQVDLLSFSRALGTKAKVSAVTFDEVLSGDATWPQFVGALEASSHNPQVLSALKKLEGGVTLPKFKMARVVDLGELGKLSTQDIDASSKVEAQASVLDLVTSTLALANESRQVALSLDGTVPGLSTVRVDLAIGERMKSSPALRVGAQDSIVRTAQTRLLIDVGVPGLNALAGVTLHVPLYIEAAYAEAQLDALRCGTSPAGDSVDIKAKPGIAKLTLGTVDTATIGDFDHATITTRATLISAPLLSVSAFAQVESTNKAATVLKFSADDIANQRVKSISTKNAVEALVTSALSKTDLDIKLGKLNLTPMSSVDASLRKSLEASAGSIDELLNAFSSVLGLQIGEADVRASHMVCERAYLVQ